MSRPPIPPFVLAVLASAVCAFSTAPAQSADAAPSPRSAASAVTESTEPGVHHAVIEDDNARVEELRVRGQTQRIVVTPKVGPRRSYEIVTNDASRDTTEGAAGGSRGATGKRVWNVMSF